jgi:hypothetical protein
MAENHQHYIAASGALCFGDFCIWHASRFTGLGEVKNVYYA